MLAREHFLIENKDNAFDTVLYIFRYTSRSNVPASFGSNQVSSECKTQWQIGTSKTCLRNENA